jgi:hypothetical protein
MDNDTISTADTTETESSREPLLRIPSLWSYDQVEEMKLKIFTDKEGFKALSKKEQSEDLAAFMWVHHVDHDENAIEAAVADGTWRDEVKRFHRSPDSLACLPEVEPRIQEMMRMMGKA